MTTATLNGKGVHTVAQLIEAEDQLGLNTISNLTGLVKRARAYVREHEVEKECAPQAPGTEEAAKGEAAKGGEALQMQDHSWWEQKVLLPKSVGSGEVDVREAIVYELSVEPFNRVSFICTWVEVEGGSRSERLCSMTYSPQVLLHFNPHLPQLKVSMHPDDHASLPNRHTLDNVLWETRLMRAYDGGIET
jgi:hypothetical protein